MYGWKDKMSAIFLLFTGLWDLNRQSCCAFCKNCRAFPIPPFCKFISRKEVLSSLNVSLKRMVKGKHFSNLNQRIFNQLTGCKLCPFFCWILHFAIACCSRTHLWESKLLWNEVFYSLLIVLSGCNPLAHKMCCFFLLAFLMVPKAA